MSDLDLTAASPLHHRSGPMDAWSTINTRENCPRAMSPLGVTLSLPLSDLSIYGAFHDLGVLRRREVVVADRPSDATAAVASHGVIVAREMGLPCVINTGNGTSLLRTGDLLRVDGGAVVVRVLEPASGTSQVPPRRVAEVFPIAQPREAG